MDNFLLYSVNIAMEATIILMLLIMLFALIRQKKLLSTTILYVSIDLHKRLLIERKEREAVELKTQIMLSQMQVKHYRKNGIDRRRT